MLNFFCVSVYSGESMLPISGSWSLFVSGGCTVYNMSLYSGESLIMTQRIICSAVFDMCGGGGGKF
jgi:hypothetical protein